MYKCITINVIYLFGILFKDETIINKKLQAEQLRICFSIRQYNAIKL